MARKESRKILIPTSTMQDKIIMWYHHYLQHLGTSQMTEALCNVVYLPNMRGRIKAHCKTCQRYHKDKVCKLKYGQLPPKIYLQYLKDVMINKTVT